MRKVRFAILLGLACLLPLAAQEDNDSYIGGAYGYTTINFDPSTNTVTLYAETDADPYDYDYYSPGLQTGLNDNNGPVILNSNDSRCFSDTDGQSYASVSCSIQGQSDDTYTAVSSHWMQVYIVDYVEGRQYNYDDIYGFNSFASLDLSSPLGQVYMPPFYEVIVKSNRLPLGKTTASHKASPPPYCGDVRDQILQEYYVKPMASFSRSCNDFTSSVNWQYPGGFSFLTLAPTQSTGYGQWAVIQTYMANNLRSVLNDLGNLPDITSGYRNPAKEASVGRYFPNSRHMAGDAIDLRTGGSQTVYLQQQAAGHQEHGCVEPVDSQHGPQTDYNHTHIDWRTLGSGNFPGSTICPRGW